MAFKKWELCPQGERGDNLQYWQSVQECRIIEESFCTNYTVWFCTGGFYDRGKDLNWKNLKDMGYLAAMGRAGGGRNETDPRFISLFSVFNMTFPSEESLFLIYSSILKGHLQPFEKVLQGEHPVSVHNIYNGTIEYVIFFCL